MWCTNSRTILSAGASQMLNELRRTQLLPQYNTTAGRLRDLKSKAWSHFTRISDLERAGQPTGELDVLRREHADMVAEVE